MAGYKNIKDAIVTILQSVSSLAIVYSKEAKLLDSFPAATVSAKQHTNDYYTIGSLGPSERVYQHFIRIYFQTDDKNNPDYEDVLESTVDAVVSAFDSNITLNGACDYAIILSGQWLVGQKESPTRVCEMVIQSTTHPFK